MTTLSASRVSGPQWTSVDLGGPQWTSVWRKVFDSQSSSLPFASGSWFQMVSACRLFHVRHGEAPNSKDCHSSNGTLDRCTEGSPMEEVVRGWWVMLPGPSRYAEIMAERERANTAGFVKKKATKKYEKIMVVGNSQEHSNLYIWNHLDRVGWWKPGFADVCCKLTHWNRRSASRYSHRDTVETKSRCSGQCFPTAFHISFHDPTGAGYSHSSRWASQKLSATALVKAAFCVHAWAVRILHSWRFRAANKMTHSELWSILESPIPTTPSLPPPHTADCARLFDAGPFDSIFLWN